MATNPASDARVEPSVDDQFLDMVCADADLLRAEFEAIVAAEWLTPPMTPHPQHPARVPPRPSQTRRHLPCSGQVRQRPCHPGIGGWARQRSPPFPTPDARQTERQVIATREPTLTR
jgi:hypothetical protein